MFMFMVPPYVHAAWTCTVILLGGKCSTDMQQQHERAAWICTVDMQHGQAARTCSMDMRRGHAARDMNMQKWRHRQAA